MEFMYESQSEMKKMPEEDSCMAMLNVLEVKYAHG